MKTIQIPVLIKEVKETGLISEEMEEVLKHEKLLAEEKVKNLQRLEREDIISYEQMEAAINRIRQELSAKILQFLNP